MGTLKIATEGGSGGKRGHSNMDHWFYTDEIKYAARRLRRRDDRSQSRAGMLEYLHPASQQRYSPSRRTPSTLQLRRDGKHCPLCLALIKQNHRRTRRRRSCVLCTAHPQPTKTCAHCGERRLWQVAGSAACQHCGRHGRARTMIATT